MHLTGKRKGTVGAAIALVAVLLVPAAAQAKWTAYDRPAKFQTVEQDNLPVEMRDGVVLRVNVQRPAGDGRHPTILIQTPYNKDGGIGTFLGGSATYFAERGYGVITADVRGTGSSGGEWDSFGPKEQRDGPELVEWARTRPWSSGEVALWGPVLHGHPPALHRRPAPARPEGDLPDRADGRRLPRHHLLRRPGEHLVHPALARPRHRRRADPDPARPTTRRWRCSPLLSHLTGAVNFQAQTVLDATAGGDTAFDGPFWKTRSPLEVVDRIRVPAFVVGGHHDLFQRGEPLVYERLKRRVPARLLMGPWTHVGGSSGEGLPRDGVPSLNSIALRWFDRFLLDRKRATRIGTIPRVTQWVYGRGRYLTQRDWPDPRLKLRADVAARRRAAGGAQAADAGARAELHPAAGFGDLHPVDRPVDGGPRRGHPLHAEQRQRPGDRRRL